MSVIKLHLSLALTISLSGTSLAQFGNPALITGDFFVDPVAGNDANIGTSWLAPLKTIDNALSLANAAQPEIWVKSTTPTTNVVPGATRSSSFVIDDNIHLRGGFDGTESTLADRPKTLFTNTVLSGDINGDSGSGTISDDAYHVVRVTRFSDDVIIDGFQIEYGNADDNSLGGTTVNINGVAVNPDSLGGGIYFEINNGGYQGVGLANLVVENCSAAYAGGGIFVDAIGGLTIANGAYFSRITVRDCRALGFLSGSLTGFGGGLYGNRLSFNIRAFNSTFDGNRSISGGGAYLDPVDDGIGWQSCRFMDNRAQRGGAIAAEAAVTHEFSNCTFAFNETAIPVGASGGGSSIYVVNSSGPASVVFESSIAYFNTTTTYVMGGMNTIAPDNFAFDAVASSPSHLSATYSCIELSAGTTPPWYLTGSISVDPLFVNGGARNLRLQAGSACIDSGNDGGLLLDLANLDDDGDSVSEFVPRDLGETLREIDAAGVPDTGVDGGNTSGAIADMGCFEVRL
ncbi:MAG: hypothetical protein AAGA95_14930 [Pseudomonadota bacterium]